MTTQAASAELVKAGLPKNTCKLGAGVMDRQEASSLSHAGETVPLSITDNRGQTGFYWLSCNGHNGELLGYRVTEDKPGGVCYDLPADLSSCDCRGFQGWQNCKHQRSLVALRERGLIR